MLKLRLHVKSNMIVNKLSTMKLCLLGIERKVGSSTSKTLRLYKLPLKFSLAVTFLPRFY